MQHGGRVRSVDGFGGAEGERFLVSLPIAGRGLTSRMNTSGRCPLCASAVACPAALRPRQKHVHAVHESGTARPAIGASHRRRCLRPSGGPPWRTTCAAARSGASNTRPTCCSTRFQSGFVITRPVAAVAFAFVAVTSDSSPAMGRMMLIGCWETFHFMSDISLLAVRCARRTRAWFSSGAPLSFSAGGTEPS